MVRADACASARPVTVDMVRGQDALRLPELTGNPLSHRVLVMGAATVDMRRP